MGHGGRLELHALYGTHRLGTRRKQREGQGKGEAKGKLGEDAREKGAQGCKGSTEAAARSVARAHTNPHTQTHRLGRLLWLLHGRGLHEWRLLEGPVGCLAICEAKIQKYNRVGEGTGDRQGNAGVKTREHQEKCG